MSMKQQRSAHNDDWEKARLIENYRCPGCGSTDMYVFYDHEGVPVHDVMLMPTREEALNFPKGDILLAFCNGCGFISNLAFDPSLLAYSAQYEETQGFSPTFNAFHTRLANHLIEKHDLRGKVIIEIGCGTGGEFLTLLCTVGGNRGIGFDPAYVDERSNSEGKNQISFIKDFYSEDHAKMQADFICCKMTLEHIENPYEFVSMVRRSIRNRSAIVFFQVPDVVRILEELAFWDIYYEHCSYFTSGSLSRLFQRCGFEVIDTWKDYDDQYLMIDARIGNAEAAASLPQEDDLDTFRKKVLSFSKNVMRKLEHWRKIIRKIEDDRTRAVIWGAGSKGVAFLTRLNVKDEVCYAVDINPYKHGTYMAGTGQEIVPPEFLRAYKPDLIIVMNPVYLNEINQELRKLGVSAKLMGV
jgi:SAM-dependent methyltransferase